MSFVGPRFVHGREQPSSAVRTRAEGDDDASSQSLGLTRTERKGESAEREITNADSCQKDDAFVRFTQVSSARERTARHPRAVIETGKRAAASFDYPIFVIRPALDMYRRVSACFPTSARLFFVHYSSVAGIQFHPSVLIFSYIDDNHINKPLTRESQVSRLGGSARSPRSSPCLLNFALMSMFAMIEYGVILTF